MNLQATFNGLKPYEVIRYHLTGEHGILLGYISRHHSDGRDHWYLWNDNGLWCEYRTRKAAITEAIRMHRSK
jgi:hypothetical protein